MESSELISLLLFFITIDAFASSSLMISSHRGLVAEDQVGENQYKAIKEAVDLGVDYIELDLQVSRDGVVFLYHDFFFESVANKIAQINKLSYQEIKKKIPLVTTLDVVIRDFPRQALHLNPKNFTKDHVEKLINTLNSRGRNLDSSIYWGNQKVFKSLKQLGLNYFISNYTQAKQCHLVVEKNIFIFLLGILPLECTSFKAISFVDYGTIFEASIRNKVLVENGIDPWFLYTRRYKDRNLKWARSSGYKGIITSIIKKELL
jgi:hypothetical protein